MASTPAAEAAPVNPSPLAGLNESQPILASANIPATLRFYCGVLGFQKPWTWGDPPGHGGVERGKVSVMFSLQPALAAHMDGHQHFFLVDNIDALYAEHQRNNAPIVAALETKPWGMREYIVRDPAGYRLRFAQPAITAPPAAKKALPPEYTVVDRCPTLAEYGALIHAVEWQPYTHFSTNEAALARSLFSVVVEHHGVCVATGRLAGDGVKFIYVTDIMVDRAHQRRGLGTAVMDRLMGWIDQHAPDKLLVGLFTGRNLNGFYAQWGFAGGDRSLWGMSRRR